MTATYEGEVFGVPFDIHGSLWHVNVDLMEEAGLVDESGMPIMPTSADDLLAQCQQVQDATGKQYFGHDWFEFQVGARLFLGLVWQQGGDLYDGSMATVVTPEKKALRTSAFSVLILMLPTRCAAGPIRNRSSSAPSCPASSSAAADQKRNERMGR